MSYYRKKKGWSGKWKKKALVFLCKITPRGYTWNIWHNRIRKENIEQVWREGNGTKNFSYTGFLGCSKQGDINFLTHQVFIFPCLGVGSFTFVLAPLFSGQGLNGHGATSWGNYDITLAQFFFRSIKCEGFFGCNHLLQFFQTFQIFYKRLDLPIGFFFSFHFYSERITLL